MNQPHRIIALIDFSGYTETLLQFSRQFSEFLGAKVILVHQVAGLVPARASAGIQEQFLKEVKEEAFEKLKAEATNVFNETPAILVSEERIPEILNELKTEEYFDWVFLGLKGSGTLKQLFIGSTALDVVNDTDFLTFTFPLTRDFSLPEELVIAVNPKYPVKQDVLKKLISSLSATARKISFVSIITAKDNAEESRRYLQQLRDTCCDASASVTVFRGADPLDEMQHYMSEKKHACLVVQQGSRKLSDVLFRKFFINELVYKGTTPLIVISK